ncbi:MAG: PQQ-binding-like beta-propeller repeat protein [Thermomicrobiales bacterium]
MARSSDEWVEGEEHVYAVSPDDGTVRWETTGHADLQEAALALSLADGSVAWTHPGTPAFLGPSYVDGTVFYGEHVRAGDIALDAATGREEWQAKMASTDEFDGRSSPSVTSDLVVVATVSGVVVGIDRGNGEIRWRENAVSGPSMVFGDRQCLSLGTLRGRRLLRDCGSIYRSVNALVIAQSPCIVGDQPPHNFRPDIRCHPRGVKDTGKLVALRSPQPGSFIQLTNTFIAQHVREGRHVAVNSAFSACLPWLRLPDGIAPQDPVWAAVHRSVPSEVLASVRACLACVDRFMIDGNLDDL